MYKLKDHLKFIFTTDTTITRGTVCMTQCVPGD